MQLNRFVFIIITIIVYEKVLRNEITCCGDNIQNCIFIFLYVIESNDGEWQTFIKQRLRRLDYIDTLLLLHWRICAVVSNLYIFFKTKCFVSHQKLFGMKLYDMYVYMKNNHFPKTKKIAILHI